MPKNMTPKLVTQYTRALLRGSHVHNLLRYFTKLTSGYEGGATAVHYSSMRGHEQNTPDNFY
jgi:hypothetical protein